MQHLLTKDQPDQKLDSLMQLELLYNRYADILNGYLIHITGNPEEAEEQLSKVFNCIHRELGTTAVKVINNWPALLNFTKKTLVLHKRYLTKDANPFDYYLSDEQWEVFYGSYYRAKSVSEIAIDLKKPKEEVRKILRATMSLIRINNII